jgi:hypothetical protein
LDGLEDGHGIGAEGKIGVAGAADRGDGRPALHLLPGQRFGCLRQFVAMRNENDADHDCEPEICKWVNR